MELVDVTLAAGATVLATQVLKYVPVSLGNSRVVAAVVALVASVVTVAQTTDGSVFSDPSLLVSTFIGTVLIATATYNNLVKGK